MARVSWFITLEGYMRAIGLKTNAKDKGMRDIVMGTNTKEPFLTTRLKD